MKLTIAQPVLAALLAKGGAVAPKNHPVPILNHVRLTAGAFLAVASTDGDRFAEASDEAQIETEGATTVNAAALSALISRYPRDGVVSLELETPSLLRVKCGRSRVGMPALPVGDFPDWAAIKGAVAYTMAGPDLAAAFARVKGLTMPAPNTWEGIFVELGEGTLNVVAYNGHAMGWLRLPMPEGAVEAPPMILAAATVDAVTRLFKGSAEVTIHASEEKVVFEADGAKLASKLIVGKVPPYQRLIEQRGEKVISLDRAEFLACLDRAVLSAESEGALHMVTASPGDDGLELKARNHKGGEALESMAFEGVAFEPAGFNPPNLRSILAGIPGERFVIEEVIRDSRYLIHGEGDESFIAGIAPIKLGGA
jgi:DNA polymerase-3 subunit beta